MRGLILSLDALPTLRDSADVRDCDLSGIATLSELAGVSALRLGVNEQLRPATEMDVMELRRGVRRLELRMPASQGLLKVALEARPDRVILAAESRDGKSAASPVDPRSDAVALMPIVRSLEEAGISTAALIAPELDAVKAAHGLGVRSVEFFTGTIVDLPESERRSELEKLGDAARIASKLRLASIGVGGGLDFYSAPEVLEAAPVVDCVSVGRAIVARSILIGIDRVVRDFSKILN